MLADYPSMLIRLILWYIGPKEKFKNCPNIQINGSEIKEVSSAKFLGVFIDNKLSWAEHINHISRKVSKSIGIIIKARKSFDNDTLLNLYNALILAHISYCIQVWGTAASVHIERRHVLQKKIVIIICGVHPRTHTQPLFPLLHLLSINQIRDYFVAIFTYKMKMIWRRSSLVKCLPAFQKFIIILQSLRKQILCLYMYYLIKEEKDN